MQHMRLYNFIFVLSYLPENCFQPYLFLVGHDMSACTVCYCTVFCPTSTLSALFCSTGQSYGSSGNTKEGSTSL